MERIIDTVLRQWVVALTETLVLHELRIDMFSIYLIISCVFVDYFSVILCSFIVQYELTVVLFMF